MNEEKYWKKQDLIRMNMISKEGAFTMAKVYRLVRYYWMRILKGSVRYVNMYTRNMESSIILLNL